MILIDLNYPHCAKSASTQSREDPMRGKCAGCNPAWNLERFHELPREADAIDSALRDPLQRVKLLRQQSKQLARIFHAHRGKRCGSAVSMIAAALLPQYRLAELEEA